MITKRKIVYLKVCQQVKEICVFLQKLFVSFLFVKHVPFFIMFLKCNPFSYTFLRRINFFKGIF